MTNSKYQKYLELVKNTDKVNIQTLLVNMDDSTILNSIFSAVRQSDSTNSFKLTSTGHYILNEVMECFKCEIQDNDKLVGKMLIKFDRIMDVPWCIQGKILYIFDESIAFNFMLTERFETFINLYE